jgi:tRNA (guanine-N7-)-methyltransferase
MGKGIYQDIAIEAFVHHYEESRPIEWKKHFLRSAPLEVEIGCGLGEFLVRQARNNPDRNFVGIEQDWARVKKTLLKIGLFNRMVPEKPLGRQVKILQIDAVVAFERLFLPDSIHKVYCLFPCPWPKKSHIKYRLFSRPFFRLVNSRLVQGGHVQIVTDHTPYFEWLLEEMKETGFESRINRIKPQFDTKFERKWCHEGHEAFWELLLIKKEHHEVPFEEDESLRVYFVNSFDPNRLQMDPIKGEISIIPKDFLFDAQREKAMMRLVVAEKSMTQHVWLTIVKSHRGWCIAKAEGHTALPTKGVALALQHVYQSALKCSLPKNSAEGIF